MAETPPPPDNASLIRLHEFTQAELTRYRDLEWQIPTVVLVFLSGVTTALSVETIRHAVSGTRSIQVSVTLLIVVLDLMVLNLLVFTQKNMRQMYRLLNQLEDRLHVKDIVTNAIVPSAKKRRIKLLRTKTVFFFAQMVIVAVGSWIAFWFVWAA